jgi:hypothetical protein
MKRRHYLALVASGTAGIAGCGGAPETATERTETATRRTTEPPRTPASETRRPTDTPPEETEADRRRPNLEALPAVDTVDSSNPFVYVNDIPLDNFNGELALAMGSDADGVELAGYLHEFPVVPWWDGAEKFERAKELYAEHHERTRSKAVQSGFTDLPPAEFGLYDRHEKPDTGRVEDTEPIGSTGTDTIVEAAQNASRDNPLVVAAGGPLCTLADAYLTDPSIAERVVLFWRSGLDADGWNAALSGWSMTVVLRRMTTVICPANGGPRITRERVENELPDGPLTRYMLNKVYDGTNENPFGDDGVKWGADAIATLSPAHPETRGESRDLRLAGLKEHWKLGRVLQNLEPAAEPTNVRIIESHDHPKMNDAWWGHVADPTTWDSE